MTTSVAQPMRHLVVRASGVVPRPLAKVLYDATVGTELALERARGAFRPRGERHAGLLDEVTAIVKTFERPRIVRRLVRSALRRYPSLKLIVVDDSRNPVPIPGVETIVMPYDSGVSAGRQAALDRVETRYVVLLDDDHVFYRYTNLEDALAIIEANPEIDLMGGDEVLLPFYSPSEFWQGDVYPTRPPTRPHGSRIAGLRVCDRVPNFFLSRTEQVRTVGWDPGLRTLDHIDFFSRARGVLTSVFNPDLRVLHGRTPFDSSYMERRLDFDSALAILFERYGDAVYTLEGVSRDRYPPAAVSGRST